ncbi:hypothetical protein DFH28DRAFT_1085170 [Melampsora americana]|nr:hypothetical protein DFH28DRAFT_1085170 [Melampsora americana]
MKRLSSMLILGLNLSQSFLVRSGLENLDAEDTFVRRYSKTHMLNSFSFGPEHPSSSHDVIGTINEANILSYSMEIIPYAAFFRKSKEIKDRTHNAGTKELADLVISMILTLRPTSESWEDWLKRNEETVNYFVKLASFNREIGCDEIERTWIVGILCTISKYSPPDVDEMNLEELLERAKVFGTFDMVKEERLRRKGFRTYNLLSRHLLQIKLPEDENGILELIKDFTDLLKKRFISEWERGYCEEVFRHILNHSPQIEKTFRDLFQDYGFFRKSYFDLAKQDMIGYVTKQTNFKYRAKHLKNIKGWKEEATTQSSSEGRDLLSSFYKNLVSRKEDHLDHHKFITASLLVFPDEEKKIKDTIEQRNPYHRQEVAKLIDVWSKVYSDGYIPDVKCGEYQWMLMVRNPAWLERVIVQQVATKLKNSMGQGTVDLARMLACEKWSMTYIGLAASGEYKKLLQDLQKADHITSAGEVYELSLRLSYHLIRFKIKCDNGFGDMSHPSQGIREIILNAIGDSRKLMMKVCPLVEMNRPDLTSGFHAFLQSISNILDNHQLDQEEEVKMVEHVMEQVGHKPHEFHWIIGGQTFGFEFSKSLEIGVDENKEKRWKFEFGVEDQVLVPQPTWHHTNKFQRASFKLAVLSKSVFWKGE